METINLILNALSLKDNNSDFELTESSNDTIDYYNYKIKNDRLIIKKIDKFNENINIKFDIYQKGINCDLSFQETLSTLNYLLSRKELINAINNSNITVYKNFKEIIEVLFSKLIVIFLDKSNSTDNILEKCNINVNICHYSLYYRNIFNNNINKTFDDYYKSLANRCFNIATNYGCIISWMTFAQLAPEMVNDDCYPIINKNTEIYKNIIWDNVKQNGLFEKEFELFNKYHSDKN